MPVRRAGVVGDEGRERPGIGAERLSRDGSKIETIRIVVEEVALEYIADSQQ